MSKPCDVQSDVPCTLRTVLSGQVRFFGGSNVNPKKFVAGKNTALCMRGVCGGM
jgi:hypothetical protein